MDLLSFVDHLRDNLITKLMAIRNKSYLETSEEDIKHGRVVSQEAAGGSDEVNLRQISSLLEKERA